jgi:RNA polymerase-binding transcription factor DksA
MDDHETRRLLADERANVADRLETILAEFDSVVDGSIDANGDDEHDPEGATIAFERARFTALADNARARLVALDRAGARLDAGTYAECEGCGGAIGAERLRARPDTRRCVDCAGGTPAVMTARTGPTD